MTDRKKEQQRARAAEARRQKAKSALDKKLAELPEFNALDEALWSTLYDQMQRFNQRADLIERWARLMQAEITAGWNVSEIALPTLTEASYGDLPDTAFTGFAVPLLHQMWGEREAADALMYWHAEYIHSSQ